jgi:hypothetical protein
MDINNLKYREKNPRKITPDNLEKLKRSLKDDPEFLEDRQILVNDTK